MIKINEEVVGRGHNFIEREPKVKPYERYYFCTNCGRKLHETEGIVFDIFYTYYGVEYFSSARNISCEEYIIKNIIQ